MSKSPIISIQNFSMRFGSKQVINDLTFEVNKGDVFGLLGSNGSGKTTIIRTLLGIYQPSAGNLLINGQKFSPGMDITLGYLPEERGLYKKESVIDTMVYFGMLKNMERNAARTWSQAYLDRVELGDKANERLDTLSGGQQQKVQLGVTIMNNPQLLILDEPTKGFDPVNRRLMMDIVQERMNEGATVVLVTHQMEEVERLCNRLILLKDGKSRLYGTMSDIKKEHSTNAVDIRFTGKLDKKSPIYSIIRQTKNTAQLVPTHKHSSQDIFNALAKQKDVRIHNFSVDEVSLDEIFVQIYGEVSN